MRDTRTYEHKPITHPNVTTQTAHGHTLKLIVTGYAPHLDKLEQELNLTPYKPTS